MTGFTDLIGASAESLINEDLRTRNATSWSIGWLIYDNAGSLVDFTGGTAILTIKDLTGATLSTFTETLTAGKKIVLANGSVTITATPAASTLAPTTNFNGTYEMKVTLASNTVSLVSGKMNIFS